MDCDIIVKNFRCFPDSHPLRLKIRKGFTAFVGPNNSGKSSILRAFFEFRLLFQTLENPNAIMNALGGTQSFQFPEPIEDVAEIFSNVNDRDLTIEIAPTGPWLGSAPRPELVTIVVPRSTNVCRVSVHAGGRATPAAPAWTDGHILFDRQTSQQFADMAPVIELFQQLRKTLYIGPFRNAINVGSSDPYFDLQVGEAFITAWRDYKSGSVKANSEAAYRVTEEIREIFGFSDLEINPASAGKTLQIFVNGRSFKLREVGAGLTQFAIVLATAAIKRPEHILIDEPELNLHPSLQLDFLTTLGSYAKESVMFATHSIGLARAAADSIFSVRSLNDGVSEVRSVEDTPRLPEFLGELSYSGYRELGFQRVLLVEGSTEIKTMQQFLRMLKKDHQIVMLPLGGSTMIKESSAAELEEVCRITKNVSALIDSERDKAGAALAKDRSDFAATCTKLGITCHVLERRATENYLTERAIQAIKGSKYRELGHYEELKSVPISWAKNENWRIAREMRFDEIEQTDLGKFLRDL